MNDKKLKESGSYLEKVLVDDMLLIRMKKNINSQMIRKKSDMFTKIRYTFIGGLASGIAIIFLFFYVDGQMNHYSTRLSHEKDQPAVNDQNSKFNSSHDPTNDFSEYDDTFDENEYTFAPIEHVTKEEIIKRMKSADHYWNSIQGSYTVFDERAKNETTVNFNIRDDSKFSSMIQVTSNSDNSIGDFVYYSPLTNVKGNQMSFATPIVHPFYLGIQLHEQEDQWTVEGNETFLGEHATLIKGRLSKIELPGNGSQSLSMGIAGQMFINHEIKLLIHTGTGVILNFEVYSPEGNLVYKETMNNVVFNKKVNHISTVDFQNHFNQLPYVGKLLKQGINFPKNIDFAEVYFSTNENIMLVKFLVDTIGYINLAVAEEPKVKNYDGLIFDKYAILEELKGHYRDAMKKGESLSLNKNMNNYYYLDNEYFMNNTNRLNINNAIIWKEGNRFIELSGWIWDEKEPKYDLIDTFNKMFGK